MRTGKRDCTCPRVRHVHGTYMAYDHDNCRCLRCAIAYSEWKRLWRAGDPDRERNTIDGTGTRRRLRALTVMGWSPPELARQLGMNEQSLLKLRNSGAERRVLPSTFKAVCEMYDRLWATPSPGPHAVRLANLAARRGWVPPLAWDDIDDPNAIPNLDGDGEGGLDEIAVERFISGTLRAPRNAPTSPERVEAVRRLAARGMSDSDIGQRVGMTPSNVGWFRHRHGIPAGVRASGGGGVAA